MTIDSPSGIIAASVDLDRREFFRGSEGARLGASRACVAREARDPILLGSSIPPKLSIGPKAGAVGDTR